MRQGCRTVVGCLIGSALVSVGLTGCRTDPAPTLQCRGPWVVLPGAPRRSLSSAASEDSSPAKERAATESVVASGDVVP